MAIKRYLLSIYDSTAFVDLGRFFSFNLYTVGRTPWMGDQPVAKSLLTHRATQKWKKCTQDIHDSSGICTHDLSVRAGEDDSCLRPRYHYDSLNSIYWGSLYSTCVSTPRRSKPCRLIPDQILAVYEYMKREE
jgi:hypothetical protein